MGVGSSHVNDDGQRWAVQGSELAGMVKTSSAVGSPQARNSSSGTPRAGRLKPRHSRSDFGGDDSHLLKVRRIGRDFSYGDNVRDAKFGFYLSRQDEDGETQRQGGRSEQND